MSIEEKITIHTSHTGFIMLPKYYIKNDGTLGQIKVGDILHACLPNSIYYQEDQIPMFDEQLEK